MAQGLQSFFVNALPIAPRRPFGRSRYNARGSTMRIHMRAVSNLTKVLIIGAAGLVLGGAPVRAQASLSGTYNCVSVEIAGKARHCKAPSLEMNSDGSYQILSERGTYEILKGHWLVLSAGKNRGRARLDGSKVIIFEFLSGGKKSRLASRFNDRRPS